MKQAIGCVFRDAVEVLLRAFLSTVKVALAGLLVVLLCGCQSDATNRGVLESAEDWPDSIQSLQVRLREVDPAVEMEGYLLSGRPGPSSIEEAVFRVRDVSTELANELKSALHLVSIPHDHELADQGNIVVAGTPADWWCSLDHGDNRLFASQAWLDGDEGDLYVVAHEVSTNTIYIYYYFNF